VPSTLAKTALQELGDEATPVTIEGLKGTRYVTGSLEVPEDAPKLRLLAKFDPLILSHKEKSLFLPNKHLADVFRKAGQVEAVILSAGIGVGTWRLERRGETAIFRIERWRELKKREQAALEKEAHRMAKMLGYRDMALQAGLRL
jgi:hypothetical protein